MSKKEIHKGGQWRSAVPSPASATLIFSWVPISGYVWGNYPRQGKEPKERTEEINPRIYTGLGTGPVPSIQSEKPRP